MTSKKIFYNTLPLLFSIILLISANLIKKTPKPIEVSKQLSALNIKDQVLLFFSIGQKRLMSDLFWITTLLESDLEHYHQSDLNSWMFLRFKSIIALDPNFLKAYQFGAKYLNIIKDDLYGSKYIYEKGLEKYPNDFDLLFNSGFLYFSELKDYKNALKSYERLIKLNLAPRYVKSLVAKIKFEKTQSLEDTFYLLENMLKKEIDETLIFKFKNDLYAIKAQIDLKCLNEKNKDCDRFDYLGDKYIFDGKKYRAQKEFEPYRLFRVNN